MDILTRVIIPDLVQSESHVLCWDRIQTSDDLGHKSKLCVFQVSRRKSEKTQLCAQRSGKGQRALSESPVPSAGGADGRLKSGDRNAEPVGKAAVKGSGFVSRPTICLHYGQNRSSRLQSCSQKGAANAGGPRSHDYAKKKNLVG